MMLLYKWWLMWQASCVLNKLDLMQKKTSTPSAEIADSTMNSQQKSALKKSEICLNCCRNQGNHLILYTSELHVRPLICSPTSYPKLNPIIIWTSLSKIPHHLNFLTIQNSWNPPPQHLATSVYTVQKYFTQSVLVYTRTLLHLDNVWCR